MNAMLRLETERPDALGRFSGYASLFGVADLQRDVVEPGAFAASVRRKGADGIRMLFQHDPAQPIGRWIEIAEDARGLFVVGRIATGVRRAMDVFELMRGGALDGLSIGFRTLKARRDGARGLRRIVEADLWEVSVVTFPMLPGARIAQLNPDRPEWPAAKAARLLRHATNSLKRKEHAA